MCMQPDFEPLDQAIEKAISSGASEAEAYLERELGLTIKIFDGRVERFSYSETRGIGLRVYLGDRQGRAYTSDLGRPAVDETVRSAVAGAEVSPEDPHRKLPDPSLFGRGTGEGAYLGEELDILGDDLERVRSGEKIEFAMELERLAREYDPRVTGVETAAYSESTSEILLASTAGFRSGFRSSICYGYLMAIAEQDGDSQTGFGFTAGRSFASLDAESAAQEAASMAVDLLGARQVETARVPVLIDNISTAELLVVMGAAISGEFVTKGRSYLTGRLGDSIASESVTVVDDGLMQGGFGTAPFDGEGVAAKRKVLVEAGELRTYLHNCYTASRMGAETTGNAQRQSFRGQVGVGPTNVFLEPGEQTPEELMSGMGTGFMVMELQGVHVGLNPVSGEVSVGAKGRWVEGGRPVHPVREVTIAGTMDDMLKGIVGIGSDLRFTPLLGGIGTPSILVEGLAVSGK
jgi:PmbA protein